MLLSFASPTTASSILCSPSKACILTNIQITAKTSTSTPTTESKARMITCTDGTVNVEAHKCHGELLGGTTILHASSTSLVESLSQVTGTTRSGAVNGNDIFNNVAADVTGALASIEGLSGTLLATILAEVTAALSLVKNALGRAPSVPAATLTVTDGKTILIGPLATDNLASKTLPVVIRAIDGEDRYTRGGHATSLKGSLNIPTILATAVI